MVTSRQLTVCIFQFTHITLSWCSVIVNSGAFRLMKDKKSFSLRRPKRASLGIKYGGLPPLLHLAPYHSSSFLACPPNPEWYLPPCIPKFHCRVV